MVNKIKPYEATGRFKTFSANTELSPGIRAKLSAGHTSGHTVYEIQNGGQQLIVWRDLVHVAAVQFADPSVTIQFDSDSSAAAMVRKEALLDASEHGYWFAGAHIAFPGIGHVLNANTGFEFVPASYRSVP